MKFALGSPLAFPFFIGDISLSASIEDGIVWLGMLCCYSVVNLSFSIRVNPDPRRPGSPSPRTRRRARGWSNLVGSGVGPADWSHLSVLAGRDELMAVSMWPLATPRPAPTYEAYRLYSRVKPKGKLFSQRVARVRLYWLTYSIKQRKVNKNMTLRGPFSIIMNTQTIEINTPLFVLARPEQPMSSRKQTFNVHLFPPFTT